MVRDTRKYVIRAPARMLRRLTNVMKTENIRENPVVSLPLVRRETPRPRLSPKMVRKIVVAVHIVKPIMARLV